ncbi:MAG: peptidylprolyl isomerase [Thaumarchaeota archaeon]|nr:peptidylprolyl isomerase [Nitrososphaerota archaeon]|tara:strand:- start:7161 stop:7943 length:783 start_codon:yes stop_codon:yes gene_type:complete
MNNGDLILLDFTAKVKDTGDIIETTIEEEGKKIGDIDEDFVFKPRLVAVGDSWVLKGLDEALAEAEIGKQVNIDISPEKGFGVRDASKTRLVPLKKFRDKADQISVGAEIEIDGRIGIVRFVGSGRAQIDFNHRYAGRTLEYNFTVVKKIEDNKEMINEIIERRIPNSIEKINVEVEQSVANIRIPDEYFLLEGLQIIKRAIANEIMKYVKDVNEVSYIEQFKDEKQVQDDDKNKEESTEQETVTDDSNVENESSEEKIE